MEDEGSSALRKPALAPWIEDVQDFAVVHLLLPAAVMNAVDAQSIELAKDPVGEAVLIVVLIPLVRVQVLLGDT